MFSCNISKGEKKRQPMIQPWKLLILYFTYFQNIYYWYPFLLFSITCRTSLMHFKIHEWPYQKDVFRQLLMASRVCLTLFPILQMIVCSNWFSLHLNCYINQKKDHQVKFLILSWIFVPSFSKQVYSLIIPLCCTFTIGNTMFFFLFKIYFTPFYAFLHLQMHV